MRDDRRGAAAALMREALTLLDRDGEHRATPHLQLALDILDEAPPALEPDWRLPTCH